MVGRLDGIGGGRILSVLNPTSFAVVGSPSLRGAGPYNWLHSLLVVRSGSKEVIYPDSPERGPPDVPGTSRHSTITP